MDPTLKGNSSDQSQDPSDADSPLPLTENPLSKHVYEDIDVFPDPGGLSPSESQTKLQTPLLVDRGEGSGNTDQKNKKEPPPIPSRHPALRTRLPSACSAGQHAPPPVPPRTRLSHGSNKKQFSFDLSEPTHKLNRSRTEVDHVSISLSSDWKSSKIRFRPKVFFFAHQDPWAIDFINTPEGSTKSLASFCAATSK